MTKKDTTLVGAMLFPNSHHVTNGYQVLEQCALKRDLELFDAGDQTEVGEKGLTLRYVSSELV